MAKTYSIKDLETLSGIKAHTIRIWEQRYSLFNPQRTDTNIRRYSGNDLKLLLNIAVLSAEGYRISKIAKLDYEEVAQTTYKLLYSGKSLDKSIEALKIAMMDLDEEKFMKVIDDLIFQNGFEHTMTELIYPFLVLVGDLWQTGALSPMNEHFASSLIRQKIIVAIDRLSVPKLTNKKAFILVCPDGEMHEIGLLFSNYIIRNRGAFSLFLGTSVPVDDVLKVIRESGIKNVLLSTIVLGKKPVHFLKELVKKKEKDIQVYISGAQASALAEYKNADGVNFINDKKELEALLTDLDE